MLVLEGVHGEKGRRSVMLAVLGGPFWEAGSGKLVLARSHTAMSFQKQNRAQLEACPGTAWIPPEGPSSPHTAMHYPAMFLLLLPGGAEAFRICAFNGQRLTLSKAAREHVMDTFVRVGSSLKESCAHDPKPLPCLTRGISQRRGDIRRRG